MSALSLRSDVRLPGVPTGDAEIRNDAAATHEYCDGKTNVPNDRNDTNDPNDFRRSRHLKSTTHDTHPLATHHEEPVALRAPERDVRANFRQADAANELSGGIPDGHAAVTELSPGIAARPEIAVHVDANAVGRAFDPVDHEIAEQLRGPQPVVGADVEDVDAAIAAASCVAGKFRKADDVELLLVG